MEVALIGTGTMGLPMAKHLADRGHAVATYDVAAPAQKAAEKAGLQVAGSAAEAARGRELAIVMVATDGEVLEVGRAIAESSHPPAVLAVTATTHPDTMHALARLLGERVAVIDAPVVWGTHGALEGKLLSLVGGEEAAVERARPALMAYSRDVIHVGPLGAGQIAKMAHNMLLWAISVANYEVLGLVKQLGVKPEVMRQILLASPAANRPLERWQHSYFTWAEKDMDIALDVAQKAKVVIPLSGLVDQLVKPLNSEAIRRLMEDA